MNILCKTVISFCGLIIFCSWADVPFTALSAGTNQDDAWFKCMADLNGDGLDDLILGASFGPHEWYESQAGDTWTKHILDEGGGTQSGGDCRDIDNDVDIDVVIGGTVYFNPRIGGSGSINDPWPNHVLLAGRAYHDVRIADLDGNGTMDVAARNEVSSVVDIYYQTSATSWTKQSSDPGFGKNGLDVYDVDGDGKPDIITSRHWMKNPGVATGDWTVVNFNGDWDEYGAITHADMNKDGRSDIVMTVSENTPGPAMWFENPADPLTNEDWTRHAISSEDLNSCHSVWVTDVNGDGFQDVFTSEFREPLRVLVFYGDSLGSEFTTQVVATAEVHAGAIGNYDGDRDIDYFGTNVFGTGPIRVFRNDGGKGPLNPRLSLDDWTYFEIDNTRTETAMGIGWGDMDGDGDIDITSGKYVYKNPGGDMSGAWTKIILPLGADANFVADVDGDDKADILAQALPNLIWFEATSAEAVDFTATTVVTSLTATSHGSSQGYARGEILGGGKEEFVFSHGGGIDVVQIPGNPDAGDWPTLHVTSDAPEEGLDVGDVDGDGLNDVIAWYGSGTGSTQLAWWKNSGDGLGDWVYYKIGNVMGTEGDRIAVGDFNDDGYLDVAATVTNNSTSGNAVHWFENSGTPAADSSWSKHDIAADQGAMNSLDAADMNGDGVPEVVTGEHRGTLTVTVWENVDKGTSWTAHIVDVGIENHLGTRLADLDRDGDLDIMGIAWDAKEKFHVWRNNADAGLLSNGNPQFKIPELRASREMITIGPSMTIRLAQGVIHQLFVYNIHGKEVLSTGNLNSREYQLNVHGLTNGLYVLKIKSGLKIFQKTMLLKPPI